MFSLFAKLFSFLFDLTHSFGLSIISLTVLVRIALFPLTAKQMRSMQAMSRVQPELKALQDKYKDDRMTLNVEMQALFKREKVSPASSCLPILFQIPVFIVLYSVIRGLSRSHRLSGFQIAVAAPKYLPHTSNIYRVIVEHAGELRSFGFNLAQSASGIAGSAQHRFPFFALLALYMATAFAQQKLAAKRTPAQTGQAAQMQSIMKYLPLIMGIFYFTMPAGLVLYFVASNLWTIAQQEVLAHHIPMPGTTAGDAIVSAKSTSNPTKSAASAGKDSQKNTADSTKDKQLKAGDSAALKGQGSKASAVKFSGSVPVSPAASDEKQASKAGKMASGTDTAGISQGDRSSGTRKMAPTPRPKTVSNLAPEETPSAQKSKKKGRK